jgi:hypothetical protein
VNPTGKVVYVSDDVLQDPASGKFSFLGIFDDVVPPAGAKYPFRLGRSYITTAGSWTTAGCSCINQGGLI